MFKKIAIFTIAAVCGMLTMTACSDSPKEVVAKANFVQHDDFHAVVNYYTEDYICEDRIDHQIITSNLSYFRLLNDVLSKNEPTIRDFAALCLADENMLKEIGMSRTEAEDIYNNYYDIPSSDKQALNKFVRDFAREANQINDHMKNTYQIIKEGIDDNIATVTATCAEYDFSDSGEIISTGKTRTYVYQLKKINKKWKIYHELSY